MRKSHYQNEGLPKVYGGIAIWNKCLEFFQKVAIVSDVFKVMGSSFQTLGAATEKAHLLSLVLGRISCCEMDNLSCCILVVLYSYCQFN